LADRNTGRLEPPVIILFGAPGSGKGTQAKLLNSRFAWPHISTGDMLRAHIAAQDTIGTAVEALMRSGRLVPDELVDGMVAQRVMEPDCEIGAILDGFPRTVPQARFLANLLQRFGFRPAVVHLVVDHGRLVARLTGRRQCPVCGTLYSNKTHPPKVPGICDLDGAALITREDDREEVIRERLHEYDERTEPVLEFFREAGLPVIETQGASKMPEQIMQSICESLLSAGLIAANCVPETNEAV
jgi:adenylate kinase